MTVDLLAARVCGAAALAVVAGSIPLAFAEQWLTFALLLWMAPWLLFLADRCHRIHVRTTSTRKDTPTA
jgi:hypothetical protein